jgi:hypothetical protein
MDAVAGNITDGCLPASLIEPNLPEATSAMAKTIKDTTMTGRVRKDFADIIYIYSLKQRERKTDKLKDLINKDNG